MPDKFHVKKEKVSNIHESFTIVKNINPDNPPKGGTSILGTPVFDIIQVRDKIVSPEVSYIFPATTSVKCSLKKDLVKTKITGNKKHGTVKELIGLDDWNIDIMGFIINYDNNDYPYDQVQELRKAVEAPISLLITSTLLNTLDIFEIVFEDLDLQDMPGHPNVQPFSIKVTSNEPIELNI